ncbi:GNAT family N-acetyltransferase [Ectobacillus antri]|jgi:RimJ/RimL family protein N-acetyltransferase|uniref:GNAT family N-acetyltransferase n=1 Tax=Ectobacillus antri TaxID=2486280 RepID=A0ABT6H4M7_9BACI|nr:GNAT family N-acetyltransferase [Ectobacillus antri]MDG4656784.1 GNAT family N-acetyltransferase [Ectobacillus antri]MDG5754319.1 GNAT family N-acetyltransferase [Ectobacillus antri]
MEVKLLQPDDAAGYWKLRLEALKNHPTAFGTSYEEALQRVNPIQQIAERFANTGEYTFGAFVEGELIGVVTLMQEKAKKFCHRATILAMYVTPEKRGRGVAKALLQAAIKRAQEVESIIKINLTVVSENVSAKALYQNLGFQVFGTEEKALYYNNVYYDEEHMVLFL